MRVQKVNVLGSFAAALALLGLSSAGFAANTEKAAPAAKPATGPADVVIYTSELPKGSLFEFDVWKDPASPGGKLVGTPNFGADLDPPPENDPHVSFKVPVQGGMAYRCWVHMKVGKPKGKSKANVLYVQFTDAVDKGGKAVLKPGTGSYLTLSGPEREGWAWVSAEPLITFKGTGQTTVRLQGGQEGVGFDQVVLSPKRFIETPPAEAIVKK